MKRNLPKKLLFAVLAAVLAAGTALPAFASGGGNAWQTGHIIYEGTGRRHTLLPENETVTPDSSSDAADKKFPEKYNALDEGLVNAPEAQAFGDCWTYSAVSALETDAAKKGFGEQHFSKSHLCYFALNGKNEGEKTEDVWNTGGNFMLAAYTFANMEGIAAQADFPNKTEENVLEFTETDRFNRASGFTVEEAAVMLQADDVKQWITQHGSAVLDYFEDGSSAYNEKLKSYMIYNGYLDNLLHPSNHAITVIGWDDTVPASAFSVCGQTPDGDGAWIVKNSWYGNDDDIMYMSYKQPISEFGGMTVREDDVYRNYTHSERGYSSYLMTKYAEQADVFTAKGNERIDRVGFTVDAFGQSKNINVTIRIYRNIPDKYSSPLDGVLAATYKTVCPCDGYFSYEIEKPVNIAKGERYAVAVCAQDADGKTISLPFEQDMEGLNFKSKAGESYVRIDKGDDFIDTHRELGRLTNEKGVHNTFVQVYTKCNHTVKEDGEKRVCTQCKKDLSEICEKHKGGYWVTTKAPTVKEEGEKEYRCAQCGTRIKTGTIPALSAAKISIVNNPGTKTVDYSDVLTLKCKAENIPDGYTTAWYLDGEKVAYGSKISVECTQETTVTVKIVDMKDGVLKNADGKETGDAETVKVNRGLIKLIIGFFRRMFGTNRTVTQ
ncbi:MAG: hypothetical protein IJK60_09190 [Clostridia bacterium]|nr:hypothetical protein [Clostridia bacterium]